MSLLNALTVDVEDYFQVTAFERHIDREAWGTYEQRVVQSTQHMLRLLERHGIQATFFVLGWVARHHPNLVRDIRRAGHEIGSHSYWHRLVYRQTPDEFRADLRLSRDVLEDILGEPVIAYRAPSFSITRQSLWALEILVEEGFRVDSSMFPTRHDRYGIPDGRPEIHHYETASGPLCEFPPSIVRWGRWRVPVSGGGYFRLYPWTWTRMCLARINERFRHPFMFYIHPWELDGEQPRLAIGSRLSRFRHYVNLDTVHEKLDWLFDEFRFGRMCDVLGEHPEAAQTLAAAAAASRA